jgi:excisionase family DNA binding protein
MDSKQFFRKQEEKIDPLALRPRDAAAALGISSSTLDRLTRDGQIPHLKINRLVLYRVDSLRQWLKDREEGEQSPVDP